MRPRLVLLTSLALISPALSLRVTSSSPQCASLCGNVLDSTSGAEMTCGDIDYAASTYGPTFKQCLTCEMSSTYHDPALKQSDLQWGIYNLRYALSWCLFGFNNNTKVASTPCKTSFSCGPLQSAFEYDGLNPNASTYSFCPLMKNHEVSIPKCTSCLAQTGNQHYLGNFITALHASCNQQPSPGSTISIKGNIFSEIPVNITSPTSVPLSTYNPTTSGLSLGAKIGIAVSGILILLAFLGFCIVWRGKRRRRRILAEKAARSGYAWQAKHGATRGPDNLGGAPMSMEEGGNGAQFFDSPQSTRPFANAWGHGARGDTESPLSIAGAEKAYFSPYQSQWNSPVSATEAPRMQEWPRDDATKKGLGLGLEEERGERIEMSPVGHAVAGGDMDKKGWHTEHVAPVLQHPGHGRGRGADEEWAAQAAYGRDDKKGHVF